MTVLLSLYAHTGTSTHQHQPFIGTLHIFSPFFSHDFIFIIWLAHAIVQANKTYPTIFDMNNFISFCCGAFHFVVFLYISHLAFGWLNTLFCAFSFGL